MPIDAMLFGGRRSTVVPLVMEARDWEHGVFLGSIMSSEKTAAATGNVGELRFDPMAMLPFCGYNMSDYFAHWLTIGEREGAKLPRIFYVNWFRRDEAGKFLWPGFGENSRVLAWIFRRLEDAVDADDTPVGQLPKQGDIDLEGLELPAESLQKLLSVDTDEWAQQLPQMREHYARFGDRLPAELRTQFDSLARAARGLTAHPPRSPGRRPYPGGVALGFIPSDAGLLILQAGVVAAPVAISSFARLERLSGRGWALIPLASIVVVVVAIRYVSDTATGLTYLALVAVPLLAAAALGWTMRGARPPAALLVIPLFALAWAARTSLTGQASAALLAALSCVTLGVLLAAVTPPVWLKAGIVLMAAADSWLVISNLLQAPNATLIAAHPAAGLPQLQSELFGTVSMGYGDLFVAALLGAVLARSVRRQRSAAAVDADHRCPVRPAVPGRQRAPGDGSRRAGADRGRALAAAPGPRPPAGTCGSRRVG